MSQEEQGVNGMRYIDNVKGLERVYIHKTNLKTYVLSDAPRLTLDGMILVSGEYHFRTIRELKQAIQEDN